MRHLLSVIAVALAFVPEADAIIDAALQMQLGNPSNAAADTNNHNHYLIQRTVEAIDYSDNLGQPNWASWDLTASDIGSSGSSTTFFVDTNLPPNFYHVGTGEYSGSGYDRGHLCPSADRTDAMNDNDLVFYMSNIMPQAPDNNSGVWETFESYCRSLVRSTNNYELLIICGPAGFNGSRINTNGYVAIPQYTWKIVVVVPPGNGTALSRITATNRVIALKVPNTNGVSTVWQNFITSPNEIQVDTGYTFFTALPTNVAAVLRSKVDGQTNLPPLIVRFSPTNGVANTSVTIAGTNFISASTVTFNGASAAFTVDSDAQITATVPTNAGSGFISVTTPSGTAISTDSFTILNDGGSVYAGVLVGWDVSTLPGGLNAYGRSPLAPTTNAPNVIVAGLTRGRGVGVSGTSAARAWGGTGFISTTDTEAIILNQFATFSVTASNGYKMSFSTVSRFDYRHSLMGPDRGVLQYQVGADAFTDIANLSYSSTSSSGASVGAIHLTGITALQNVGPNIKVTFRIVNYGGTSSAGTWYVFDRADSTALDLAVQGTVTELITNPPAANPYLSSLTFTNNQFQFTLEGTVGSNYVVQASNNLSGTNWISLSTNAAPFQFTDSNVIAFPQRFYRGLVAP